MRKNREGPAVRSPVCARRQGPPVPSWEETRGSVVPSYRSRRWGSVGLGPARLGLGPAGLILRRSQDCHSSAGTVPL